MSGFVRRSNSRILYTFECENPPGDNRFCAQLRAGNDYDIFWILPDGWVFFYEMNPKPDTRSIGSAQISSEQESQ